MKREDPGFDLELIEREIAAELAEASTRGPWIPASIRKPPAPLAAPLLLPIWMRQK